MYVCMYAAAQTIRLWSELFAAKPATLYILLYIVLLNVSGCNVAIKREPSNLFE